MGFYQDHCIYLPAMAGWFLFSALLSSYNKLVFGEGQMAFPCPLLLTSMHFLCQWIFSATVCALFPRQFLATKRKITEQPTREVQRQQHQQQQGQGQEQQMRPLISTVASTTTLEDDATESNHDEDTFKPETIRRRTSKELNGFNRHELIGSNPPEPNGSSNHQEQQGGGDKGEDEIDHSTIGSNTTSTIAYVQPMSWEKWLWISIPCGVVTAADIGLSNLSMVTLSISFYTMVKSSTPIFVLLWAYLFRIEQITWTLVAVVGLIVAGEVVTVIGEVQFKVNWGGFFLCLGATVLSGCRWTLVQLQLHRLDPPLPSSIATMRLLAPSMFVSMFLFALPLERPWAQRWTEADDKSGWLEALQIFGLGLFGAIFAIAMILCELYLILHASAVVLMIGGVVKELLNIFMGVVLFRDKLNRLNVLGCLIVFSGVSLYKFELHQKKHGNKKLQAKSSAIENDIGGQMESLIDQQEADDETDTEDQGNVEDGGIELRKPRRNVPDTQQNTSMAT